MEVKVTAQNIPDFPRIMIAAPSSGSGKTTITCALLELLKEKGRKTVSFKCGPDFIDPMFHKQVLGVPSANLDSFFCDEGKLREIFLENSEGKTAVIEGVMGLFDGLGGKSLKASSYDIAQITNTPILLVVDAGGMSRSVLPLIKGFLDYDKKNSPSRECLIKGVFLNKVSEGQAKLLKSLIEEELGIKVAGYFSKKSQNVWKSRHLGLLLPSEIENLREQIADSAKELEKSLDFSLLEAIMNNKEEGSGESPKERPFPKRNFLASDFQFSVCIAVARDEAFCFYYEENLRLLEKLGARLVYFSPLHDKALPESVQGILIGGGYPELYAKELENNKSMKESIRSAVENGASLMAECGGFMYLQEKLIKDDEVFEMCGVLKGECRYTGKLVRFGYAEFTPLASESLGSFFPDGFSIRGHEFHYFDSTNNGSSFHAQKPISKKSWDCMIFTPKMLAGFPHLYYESAPEIVSWFVNSCRK